MLIKYDIKLIFSVLLLFCIGIMSIYSVTYEEGKFLSLLFYKQLTWMVISILSVFVLLKIGVHRVFDKAYYLYGFGIVLLVLVLFFGVSRGGGHRWLKIGGFTFQPSELVKICVILVTARFLSSFKKNNFRVSNSLLLILFLLMPVILIAIQPDFGTSLVLLPVVFGIWYVSDIGFKYLITFLITGIMGSPFLWFLLKDYQKQRLLVFIKPELDPLGAGYTVIQSKIAIGSGKILGKGWLSGTQNMLNFLPERHTDFIFSVIGEEWGFLGALVVIVLYGYILKRGLDIVDSASNKNDRLIASGVVILLATHIIVNIGMTMGIVPAVGLSLPFISYGGSNLIISMICIGLLLDIDWRSKGYNYK